VNRFLMPLNQARQGIRALPCFSRQFGSLPLGLLSLVAAFDQEQELFGDDGAFHHLPRGECSQVRFRGRPFVTLAIEEIARAAIMNSVNDRTLCHFLMRLPLGAIVRRE
jgi:hypothetical protein